MGIKTQLLIPGKGYAVETCGVQQHGIVCHQILIPAKIPFSPLTGITARSNTQLHFSIKSWPS